MMGKLKEGIPVQYNYNTGISKVIEGQVYRFHHATIVNRVRLYDNGRFVVNVMNPNAGGRTAFRNLRKLYKLFSIKKIPI